MDAATLDRILTDALLMEASDGMDDAARQLTTLHESWTSAGAERSSLEWLGGLIANLSWWSGRLLGGLSCISVEQGVTDDGARSVVS